MSKPKKPYSPATFAERQIESLTKQEERQLNQMLDFDEVQDYFEKQQDELSIKAKKSFNRSYAKQGAEKVYQEICIGDLHIKEMPEDVEEYFIQQKISKQEEKALELKIKKEEILLQLHYLDMQVGSKATNPPNISSQIKLKILTKQQHEAFIEKSLKDRQLRQKNHKNLVQKLEKSRIQSQMKAKEIEERRINRRKQKRRQSIEKSLEKKKEMHEKILQEEKETQKSYNQIRKKKFLHQQIEEKYENQIIIPMLQQRKRKLREIRAFAKEFSIDNIKKHEKQYVQKRNQSIASKSRLEDEWTYKPPPKTEKLSQFLEEEKISQRKKLEEKKRAIQEKLSKQQNYIEYLKQKFRPKVDQRKKNERELRIKKTTNKRKQTIVDGKVLGIGYLQEVKRLKKKTIDPHELEKESVQSNQPVKHNYLVELRKRHKDYQSMKKQKIERLLNSSELTIDDIRTLQRESQKLTEDLKKKEELIKVKKGDSEIQSDALQLLISNIKTKIGLVNAYKESKNFSD